MNMKNDEVISAISGFCKNAYEGSKAINFKRELQ
jgi:hypothetical protein